MMYGALLTFMMLISAADQRAPAPPVTALPTPRGGPVANMTPPNRLHRRRDGLRRPLSAADGDLYSLRARRRFAAYMRFRLLELREAGLERAATVIERKLPVDALLPKP